MDIKFAPAGVMPEAPEKIARKSAKRKIQVDRAAELFEPGKQYTETEINILLMQLFEDHVFARRMMIENRILDRTPNGSTYWLLEAKVPQG
ncbi:MAG: hypothetical protein RLZ06_611 [Actinomycetota bacterium]|jgi:hypothetical protein